MKRYVWKLILTYSISVMAQLFSASSFGHDADYLPTTLRGEVEQLKRTVQKIPTNSSILNERVDVFWRWANAYAKAGIPIDPDVPTTVARLRNPDAHSNASTEDLADIDRWIREFTYRERYPKAIGTLGSPKLKNFQVDQFHSLIMTYTVGDRPLGPGDGFVLGELTYGKGPLLQARDPMADHYVSIHTEVDNVSFETDQYPIRGMFSGTMKRSVVMTGPAQKVFFRVKSGTLPAGSVIKITLGDKTKGSRGIGLIAPSLDALRFRVWLHLEQEKLLMTLPELAFSSVGGPVAGVRGFAPSIVATNEKFELTVRFEDKFRNRATGKVPGIKLMLGRKVIARVASGDDALIKIDNLSFSKPGVYRLKLISEHAKYEGEINPILVKGKPERRLYWGETHGHSGFSEGMGSVDGVYRFARDDARLDFMALTEHDYWLDDAEWEVMRAAVKKYNDPGRFLAFLAYEWTVHSPNGGHHNVLFRTPDGRSRVGRQDAPVLSQLYKGLSAANDERDVLIIPHAHNPGDWSLNDVKREKFVEIVSLHGTFEWFGRNYLDSGFMVGFLGGSDDHMGHPGLRPLRRNPTSDNYGGLLGLYADTKTNNDVFNAMRSIQGYATNGERIILNIKLNNSEMGSMQSAGDNATFKGDVYGTAPIEELIYIKNGKVIHKQDFADSGGVDTNLTELRFWSDSEPMKKGALARQWRRWRGTIEVEGATIAEFSSPQNDNPYTEFVKEERVSQIN